MRRDYDDGSFTEAGLAPTWVEQFDRWFADSVAAELPEPNAMVVATADADGVPDARIVLMKGYDADGIVFVSNYASAKGAELAVNPRAAQLAAEASLQSTVVESRDELVQRFSELDAQAPPGQLPRPANWGGYRVVPDKVEFWQGGHDRLHDRLVFVRDDEEGGGWLVQRLAP